MHNILINCPFACLLYPAMPCFLFKLKKTLSISWLSWKKLFKMPGIPRFIAYSIRRDVFVSHWIKVSLCIDSLLLFFFLYAFLSCHWRLLIFIYILILTSLFSTYVYFSLLFISSCGIFLPDVLESHPYSASKSTEERGL